MNTEYGQSREQGSCAHPLCPLNRVKAGIAVRVRQLCATPALADRLREIGFCEDRVIKLLTSHSNIICLVCNTRLALSEQLARAILVEPVTEMAAPLKVLKVLAAIQQTKKGGAFNKRG